MNPAAKQLSGWWRNLAATVLNVAVVMASLPLGSITPHYTAFWRIRRGPTLP